MNTLDIVHIESVCRVNSAHSSGLFQNLCGSITMAPKIYILCQVINILPNFSKVATNYSLDVKK